MALRKTHRIILHFFSHIREITGKETMIVEGMNLTPGSLFFELKKMYPKLKGFERKCAVAVNMEYSSWDTKLKDGDEVSFIPPVSGG